MFENQQHDDLEQFMKSDTEFRRLYRRHQRLDRKLHNADLGVLAMDDATLAHMKREKLQAKERLLRMWGNRAASLH